MTPTQDHVYARDRAPIASTVIPTIWRYRWNCSCGATGAWHTATYEGVYRGWAKHLRVRSRGRAA